MTALERAGNAVLNGALRGRVPRPVRSLQNGRCYLRGGRPDKTFSEQEHLCERNLRNWTSAVQLCVGGVGGGTSASDSLRRKEALGRGSPGPGGRAGCSPAGCSPESPAPQEAVGCSEALPAYPDG